MSGRLHRVALWLRLTLVCLVLTGIRAPAPTMGYLQPRSLHVDRAR